MPVRIVLLAVFFSLFYSEPMQAGNKTRAIRHENDTSTHLDSLPKGKNLFHLNVVSLMFREAELHYERLFFDGKIGIKPYASYFLLQHEDVRGRRSRNYSGGLAAHVYLFKNDWVRFLAGTGLEVGYYTNERILIEPTSTVPFDLSQRNERYTYYYGKVGMLFEPYRHFNVGLNFNLGSRQNRRLTNRNTFVHPVVELTGVFRF